MLRTCDVAMRSPLSTEPVIEATILTELGARQMRTEAHFRRDHFAAPDIDPALWRLAVGCESGSLEHLSLGDLQTFATASVTTVLECAGHRRGEFEPLTNGVQWGIGAMSEATWTGVRMRDLLAGVDTRNAGVVVFEGSDAGPVSTGTGWSSFARAIPIDKAFHDDTLVVWEMNGDPIPVASGGPVRAIVPGWYATDSVKWLARIACVSGEFSGHFEASDYRYPDESGAGTRRMSAVPVNSLLTSIENGASVEPGELELEGIAWCGDRWIAKVEVSVDGEPWQEASLERPESLYARTFWRLSWSATPGRHVLRVRATDEGGHAQPAVPMWNAGGYGNASVQSVAVSVTLGSQPR